MKNSIKVEILAAILFWGSTIGVNGQKAFETDTISTPAGNIEITFIGHASLQFKYQDRYYYIDPVMQLADYSLLPKADVILVTHDHGDHLDPVAIEKLSKPETEIFLPQLCFDKLKKGKVCDNGKFFIANGVPVETVAAYNIYNLRGNGKPYHARNEGNGYVLTFGPLRIYVAGDTEITPEMTKLKQIDIAFLPIGLPYTMEPQRAVEAAKILQLKILYPYHFNNSNPDELFRTLLGSPIDVRIRSMK
jgi:L-ascorbate metabolism protein UlaG (beta-lactamase superfamily)